MLEIFDHIKSVNAVKICLLASGARDYFVANTITYHNDIFNFNLFYVFREEVVGKVIWASTLDDGFSREPISGSNHQNDPKFFQIQDVTLNELKQLVIEWNKAILSETV